MPANGIKMESQIANQSNIMEEITKKFKTYPRIMSNDPCPREKERRLIIEILKRIVFQTQVLSSKIQIAEYRGKEIIDFIFKTLMDNHKLLPEDFYDKFNSINEGNIESQRKRIICDFIAGMTDNYALEFYERLKSPNPQSIFKPI